MKINVICSTIYQQAVLLIIFYWGNPWWYRGHPSDTWGPDVWYKEDLEMEVDGSLVPSDKCHAYTFIYQCFFMMQVFNFTNCRFSYEKGINPFSKLFTFLKTSSKEEGGRIRAYWRIYFSFILLFLFI